MAVSCSSLDMEAFTKTKEHIAANPDQGTGEFETVTK